MADWGARWDAAWRALEVEPPPVAERDAVLARYHESQRHYHTAVHLDECFTRLERVAARAQHAGEVALSLWYHDAVYDPRRADNEERSAALADEALVRAGVGEGPRARVRDLILATRHEATPAPGDAALLVDIDLGILAAPVARFDEYERQVRAEYARVPGMIFRVKRRGVLRGFLERPRIYVSGAFDDDEGPARANLERAIARL